MFPKYYKYTNNKSFFKVTSERNFTELQLMGQKVFLFQIEATQYPEILFIKDMLNLHEGRWVEVNQQEYEEILLRVNNS